MSFANYGGPCEGKRGLSSEGRLSLQTEAPHVQPLKGTGLGIQGGSSPPSLEPHIEESKKPPSLRNSGKGWFWGPHDRRSRWGGGGRRPAHVHLDGGGRGHKPTNVGDREDHMGSLGPQAGTRCQRWKPHVNWSWTEQDMDMEAEGSL